MAISDDQVNVSAVQHRTLRVLVAAQVFGGTGFFIGIAVSAILARDLGGSTALAGLPPAAGVAASAVAAPLLSRLMGRVGRRPGLSLGFALGAVGALVVLLAGLLRNYWLMLAGMTLFGVGNTASLLARYAAVDLSPTARRGRALGAVLLATAVGAIAGPNLAAPAGTLLAPFDALPTVGAFALSAVVSGVAALVILVWLRPDPLLLARRLGAGGGVDSAASDEPAPGSSASFRQERPSPAWGRRPALLAVLAMTTAAVVMVAVMTMTPVHMSDHGLSLSAVGVVISAHVAGMFLPSPLSGWLSDRVGPRPVIAAGGLVLAAAGVLGAVAGADSLSFAAGLVLLGLGWNLALVGGSSLITGAVPELERPRLQGNADLAMGLGGATASLSAGPVLATAGFGWLGFVGAALAAALAAVALSPVARPRVTQRA